MSIYKQIIDWAKNRPAFIQEAVRCLFSQKSITDNDYLEIKQILIDSVDGKNPSFKPASLNDIPQNRDNNVLCTKLLSIENPNNISSLYKDAKIEFAENGLNVLFGTNGTGKSSYSRILKHFCWSRQKNIILKTNIYSNETKQSVKIKYMCNGTEGTFLWPKNASDKNLNSIFVYDGESALKYITEENEIEFKPVGIEILEQISALCKRLDYDFSKQIQDSGIIKPLEKNINVNTDIGKWYQANKIYTENEIKGHLSFTDVEKNRKNELSVLLNTTALENETTNLEQKLIRYRNLYNDLKNYEFVYSEKYVEKINYLKMDYLSKKTAYDFAQQQISGTDTLQGVGSTSWKELWESAKKYAVTEVHPADKLFPRIGGEKYCVLCQQPLSDDAEKRLERFNLFITDDTNKKLIEVEKLLNDEKQKIQLSLVFTQETMDELASDVPSLNKELVAFISSFNDYKNSLNEYLQDIKLVNKHLIDFPCVDKNILVNFTTHINSIEKKIVTNKEALTKQNILKIEYDNLCEKEKLALSIDEIIEYYTAQRNINTIQKYKDVIPKTSITKEIASLLEQESIVAFNTAFYNYINELSPAISQKIEIKKGKAISGKVFQKSILKNHGNEQMTEILSEGEQKVVMLANFLAECSLDNDDCTIVFDDPINSLDYNYRDKIASIFVELSKKRQIIVLTHDFYFTRLLLDTYKKNLQKEDYKLISLYENNGITGIPSDELPYLMQNIDERVASIRSDQKTLHGFDISDIKHRNFILDSQRKRMRELLEKTVEEVFAGKSIERFSKIIQCKEKQLSCFVCVEKSDVDFLLSLFSKYSETEHDGTPNPNLATENDIDTDIKNYSDWKQQFLDKLKSYKVNNGIK